MANKKNDGKTDLTVAYEAVGDAMGNWFIQIGNRIKDDFKSVMYKNYVNESRIKKNPGDPVPAQSPSEEDNGFTDEAKWGTCTPAFIMENGMAESEERAYDLARFFKEHPEKKTFDIFQELFVKAQFKLPTDRRRNSADVNFLDLELIAKDDPIKVAQQEEKKAAEENTPAEAPQKPEVTNEAPVQNEEPNVAHPAAQVQYAVPQAQPVYGYPIEQFLRGISLESQPAAQQFVPAHEPVYAQPIPVQQAAPQRSIVNIGGILYEVQIGANGPVMVPLASVEGVQQVNPTETQQVPTPHPAGFVIKERENREIVDQGVTVEGELPGVDPSLIKEEKSKVKITPMVEKAEEPVENPLLSIVKGGHPEISEEAGNTLLWDVLSTIKDSGFTCDFREMRDEAMEPVGIYEFHLFHDDQELTDLKFIVDLGKLFDKRAKFSIGASAGLEYKEWFELQKNVGKNLVYTDEILKKFFSNGRKWLFNQKAMYNRQWREINKNFVDLSTLPEAPNKETRQTLNGIISDLYNCRELQAAISDVIPDPRFRVIEYKDGVLIMTNESVKDNILGIYRKDPLIGICYGGDGKNIATVKGPSGEVQVTVPHNSGLK